MIHKTRSVTGYMSYPNAWAGLLRPLSDQHRERNMKNSIELFTAIKELRELLEQPDALFKDDLRKLLNDLHYLRQPFVQESLELLDEVGWDWRDPNGRLNKQFSRVAGARQETKTNLEDEFNRLRNMERDNRNKRICRFRSYRAVLDNPAHATIRRGHYNQLQLKPHDAEIPVRG